MQDSGSKLTVVIRDDRPALYYNDRPSYRTVVLQLTDEQRRAVMLVPDFESISHVILESDVTQTASEGGPK